MALSASEQAATPPQQKTAVRGRSLAALAAATAVLVTAAVLLPPIIPAGADLRIVNQAAYARAIWPETQISLAMLMIFLPSLCYAMAAKGAAWGRLLIGSLSLVGVAIATVYLVISLESYMAKPEVVYGFVTSLKGQTICIEPFQRASPKMRCFALDVPSEELRGSSNWADEHRLVQMLVSRRSHVGFIAPVSGALQ